MMGVKIIFKNKRIYKGEPIADILVKVQKKLNPLIVLLNLIVVLLMNSLVFFLVAAKADGISTFKDLVN